MVNIDVKLFECISCGMLYTAPQIINRIADEFTEYMRVRIDVPQKRTDGDGGLEVDMTSDEKKRFRDMCKDRMKELCDRLRAERKNNRFAVAVHKDSDNELEISLTIEMKEAAIKLQTHTVLSESKDIELACPNCGYVSYSVRVQE